MLLNNVMFEKLNWLLLQNNIIKNLSFFGWKLIREYSWSARGIPSNASVVFSSGNSSRIIVLVRL